MNIAFNSKRAFAKLNSRGMKNIGNLPKQLGITAVLAAILAFTPPVFVNRQAFNRALDNYLKNPSAENDATLKAERAINQRQAFTMHLAAFGFLFAFLNAGWFLFHRWSNRV
jgi:hypothetical protein